MLITGRFRHLLAPSTTWCATIWRQASPGVRCSSHSRNMTSIQDDRAGQAAVLQARVVPVFYGLIVVLGETGQITATTVTMMPMATENTAALY